MNYNDPSEKKLYTTLSPCIPCSKVLIIAGIKEVIYLNEYRKKDGIDLLEKAGVKVRKMEDRDLQIEEDGKVRGI
jgi:dCMP deaminase